jgi:hypothetical protein
MFFRPKCLLKGRGFAQVYTGDSKKTGVLFEGATVIKKVLSICVIPVHLCPKKSLVTKSDSSNILLSLLMYF